MSAKEDAAEILADAHRLVTQIERFGVETDQIGKLAGLVKSLARMVAGMAGNASTATDQKDHPVLVALQARLDEVDVQHRGAIRDGRRYGDVVLGAQAEEVRRCIAIARKALGDG